MKRTRVGLVDLGERLPFSLKMLAKKLNSLQLSFEFEEAEVITADVLGEPDRGGKWFSLSRLMTLVRERCSGDYTYLIGITNCRITDTDESEPSDDPDYFSKSDFERVAITTVNAHPLRYKPAGKSVSQYVSFLVAGELAIMATRKNISHNAVPDCVFNDCEDRALLAGTMSSGKICPACVAAMKKANMPDSMLASVRSILRWSSRNTWGYAFTQTLQDPVAGLFLGGGIGWGASLFVVSAYYPIVAAGTLLPVAAILYKAKRSHD